MHADLMEGKVALVTGGSNGIARAQATLFAAEGAHVIVADIQEAAGAEVVEAICSAGGTAWFCKLDVSVEENWQEAIRLIVEKEGKLTTLLNTAGVYHMSTFESETAELYQRVVAVNQIGTFLGMKTALPALRDAGGGAILNIGSVAGVRAFPNQISYATTKAAIRIMSINAAAEFGKFNIRVNVIHPGPVKTGMLAGASDDDLKSSLSIMPLGRLATPEDIAHGSLYLCSDLAMNVTGAELPIDGGLLAR